ncbi:MAG: hypothetical protein R3297_06260 [Desulfobulbales bacterium]|nr:hypothetical protein [Desulfobulbales bacterium]
MLSPKQPEVEKNDALLFLIRKVRTGAGAKPHVDDEALYEPKQLHMLMRKRP